MAKLFTAKEAQKRADAQQPRLLKERKAKQKEGHDHFLEVKESMRNRAARLLEEIQEQISKATDAGEYGITTEIEISFEGGHLLPDFVEELLQKAGYKVSYHGYVHKDVGFLWSTRKSYKMVGIKWSPKK